jgi:hypothetical protein
MMRHLAIVATLVVLVLDGTAHAGSRPNCEEARSAVQTQIDTACPCGTATDRGTYVRCVNNKLRELSACHKGDGGAEVCGPLPRICMGTARRVAGRSTCGQPAAVTCCIPRQHDCVGDPKPGDGTKEGTCSRSKQKCDTLADCKIPACRQTSTVERCTLVGGTVGNGKDCSTACTP